MNLKCDHCGGRKHTENDCYLKQKGKSKDEAHKEREEKLKRWQLERQHRVNTTDAIVSEPESDFTESEDLNNDADL